MLALDRGGACTGLLLRLPPDKAVEELRILWKREMATGAYEARWLNATTQGVSVPALTFVADRAHERYLGALPVESVASLICKGTGPLGSSREYFDRVLDSLRGLGVRDTGMERMRAAVRQIG
jgi:cation transport protein ChaC